MTDTEFLQWVHDRLQHVHGENFNTDYMLKLRRVIASRSPPLTQDRERVEVLEAEGERGWWVKRVEALARKLAEARKRIGELERERLADLPDRCNDCEAGIEHPTATCEAPTLRQARANITRQKVERVKDQQRIAELEADLKSMDEQDHAAVAMMRREVDLRIRVALENVKLRAGFLVLDELGGYPDANDENKIRAARALCKTEDTDG